MLLSSSNQEIGLQSKELEKVKAQLELQNIKVKSKQETLRNLNLQLTKAKQQLSTYQAQENQILSEIEKIEQTIKNSTKKAVNNVRIGMTSSEVIQVCGSPRAREVCLESLFFNYGNVWVLFESNIVSSLFQANLYKGSCWNADYYRQINMK
jgi:hypothetical protein